MKVIARIALVFAVVAAVAALPASAVCGPTNNRLFGGYTYYQGWVGSETDLAGSYWVLGSFATANSGGTVPADWMNTCTGNDCGTQAVFLAGAWADSALIVGCPPDHPAAPKMIFQISGPSAGGGTVYGAGCANPDPANGNYNFGNFVSTPVPMQVVPKPNVTNSVRQGGGTSVQIDVSAPSLTGGLVDEGACNLGPTGYRIYSQNVPRGGPAPTSRDRVAPWTAQGGVNAPGAPASVNVPCVGNQDVYLAFSVILNDGQEIQDVGANSTVVQCGSTSADRPGDFKIIKKPIRKPVNEQ